MTPRERFLACCRFEPVDRIPLRELSVYGQAIDRWLTEGLPADVNIGDFYHGSEYFGFDHWDYVPVRLEMCPGFEHVVLEEDEDTILCIGVDGVKRRASKKGISHGHSPNMDQYIDFPLKTRSDFEALKPRYNPRSQARYPEWWDEHVRVWSKRDYPLSMPLSGGFGFFPDLRIHRGKAALRPFLLAPKVWNNHADFQIPIREKTLHMVDVVVVKVPLAD